MFCPFSLPAQLNSETNDIQTWSEYNIQLLNKPFVNGVTSREQNLSLRCCNDIEHKVQEQQLSDLSKELLQVSVDQRAAMLWAVKL